MDTEPTAGMVYQLDLRGAADALQQAMEMRGIGASRDPLGATLRGLAAEVLAGALMDAGYVVGVPRMEERLGGASVSPA